jgi:protease-4
MGASGAYYIACGADKIIAEPHSIVGSIGIYGGKIDATGLLSKLGVRAEPVKSHEHADAQTFARPWSESEKAALQQYMDEFYDRFVGIVSEQTGVPKATVDSAYGGGRVFVGQKALQYGLVQGLGGIDLAIKEARTLAGIGEGREIELISLATGDTRLVTEQPLRTLANFFDDIGQVSLWAIDPFLWNMEP